MINAQEYIKKLGETTLKIPQKHDEMYIWPNT